MGWKELWNRESGRPAQKPPSLRWRDGGGTFLNPSKLKRRNKRRDIPHTEKLGYGRTEIRAHAIPQAGIWRYAGRLEGEKDELGRVKRTPEVEKALEYCVS